MTRAVKKTGWLIGALLVIHAAVYAAPFHKEIRFNQPDGTLINLIGQGNDFYAVFETTDGYTVAYNPDDKTYYYAALSADGSNVVTTALAVGQGDPAALGLVRHVRLPSDMVKRQVASRYQAWNAVTGLEQKWSTLKNTRHAVEAMTQGGDTLTVMAPPTFTTTGTKVGLCLLIDFDDDPQTIPQADIIDFCNGDNYQGYGNNGSVKQYYLDNSNNLLTYTNVVTAYIRIPNSLHPKSYYNDISQDAGINANRLIRDAISILRAQPNYETEILPALSALTVDDANQVVACNVFYAGGNGNAWAYGLWPHSWSLSAYNAATGDYDPAPEALSDDGLSVYNYQVTNIGDSLEIATFCHENGHMLCGFPDIYDYDYDSIGGAGLFCLMSHGTMYENNPPQICAYLKYAAGWATITDLSVDQAPSQGTVVSSLGSPDFNHFYRFAKPGSATEYYLFENRQQEGRDLYIPASGIAIWHIDELGDRDNQSLAYNTTHANYECTLVQADNRWDFENYANYGDANDLYYAGNPAPAYTGKFSDTTAPSARWWDGTMSLMLITNISASADIMTFGFSPAPPIILSSSPLPIGRVGTPYAYTFKVTGGLPPLTWSVISNALPAGLVLDADGLLSGVPSEAATVVLGIAVTGSNTVSATGIFTLTIQPPFTPTFEESFENSGSIPDGWWQETVTNTLSWLFRAGTPSTSSFAAPKAAFSGDYCAVFYTETIPTNGVPVTRLISPMIKFDESATLGQMTFWTCMKEWSGDQDQLRVYYRTAFSNPWTLLAAYTNNTTAWKKRTLYLPTPSPTYYVAFEGTAKGGYGVCVDDVEITDATRPLAFVSESDLPPATRNAVYSQTLAAVGGVPPYTFTSGDLPFGFTLDSSSGLLSGTFTNLQTSTFNVTVSDSFTSTVSQAFSVIVEPGRAALFEEDFEFDGRLPTGWTQVYVTNTLAWTAYPVDTTFSAGFHPDHPTAAASGTFYALLYSTDWVNGQAVKQVTRLISPVINVGQNPISPRLSFWHYMEEWNTDQDELRVFYRSAPSSSWTLLATYTNNTVPWIQRSLVLPNPTETYQVAFEGTAQFGYGVCLDDVQVTDIAQAPLIRTATALTNGVINVPYQQTLQAIGGTTPYTWSVVSNTLPAGLTLSSSTGVISGTPTVGGTFVFRIRVQGADGYFSVNVFSLRILDAFSIPFTEGFESSGTSLPIGWTQDPTTSPKWKLSVGTTSTREVRTPVAAHTGGTNACLYNESTTATSRKLITPMLGLATNAANARLTFWHCMAKYGADQDTLRVWYRTSAASGWVSLTNFTANTTVWTQRVIDLPNPTDTYYLAFDGTTRYGYGVCIDDVSVTADMPQSPLSAYDQWRADHFTAQELSDGLITGDNDDPDGDGLSNLWEYIYGRDPQASDAEGAALGISVVGGYPQVTFPIGYAAYDDETLVWYLETCTNLLDHVWEPLDMSGVSRFDSNTWWQILYEGDQPVSVSPTRFYRLKVEGL